MAGHSLRLANRCRHAVLCALAAVLGEEGDKVVHRFVSRCVNHRTAIAADGDQPGEAQPIEVKCQRVGGEAELFRHLPGRHAFRPCLDEQAEDLQPVFLRQRRQGGDRMHCFHISTNIETFGKVKGRQIGAVQRRGQRHHRVLN